MAARETTKRAIVYAFMGVLTLWPLVHIGLSLHYEMSPWKLAGWGMYSTPRFGDLGMEVFYFEDGSDEQRQLTAPNAAERTAAPVFLERTKWLGRLAPPDHFAQTIFEGRPEIRSLEIAVFRPAMDPDTGMIVMRRHAYDYAR